LKVAGPTFDPPRLMAEPDDASPSVLIEPAISAMLSRTGRCPAEMAFVAERVCVDRWEASLLERTPAGEREWSPFLPVDGYEARVRAVSRAGVIPQGYISGRQAAAACEASGKRLCRATEWEVACRGPASTQFPYGDSRRAGVCNDDVRKRHPVPEAARILGIPADALWREGMNASLVNQLPNTLLPTGAREACTNGYGVFDMVGNLHEWIDDGAEERGAHGTFRGGYYMDTSKNGEGCSYATTAHAFAYHDYSTGFRCCMDPEGAE
jgi:formylglycine-generating enzyme required for sulfatase activity